MNRWLFFFLALGLFACKNESGPTTDKPETNTEATQASTDNTDYTAEQGEVGSIVEMESGLSSILDANTPIEVLASGFVWSEGPLWVPKLGALLFSDIPPNKVLKWKEGEGISTYLYPSGYTSNRKRNGEPGSNGLLLDNDGRLVLCQHGDRRVAFMDAELENPHSTFQTIADKYDGKRLNSPNDAVYDSRRALYFTDPPYGLEKGITDPAKELRFQGVYRLKLGQLQLLDNSLSRPNGIGLSPDEKTLYVANSDPNRAIWVAYDINEEGKLRNGRIFHDATETVKDKANKGLPDGLVVNQDGLIFATGPGGVYIFQSDATLLGMIKLNEAASNCTIGGVDGKSLFITNDMHLLRVRLK